MCNKKKFCDCTPDIQTQVSMTALILFCLSALTETQIVYNVGKKTHSGFPDCSNFHFYIFQEIAGSLEHKGGTLLYSQMFYAIS